MKIVLVTGGNRGIGMEICRQLDALGHTVIMGSRNLKKGREAAGTFSKNIIVRQLDVTDETSIRILFEFVKTEFGKLDVLINNAGIGANHKGSENGLAAGIKNILKKQAGVWRMIQVVKPLLLKAGMGTGRKSIKNIPFAGVKNIMETNFYGAWRMIQVFLPLLRKSGDGRILNMSSGMGELKSLSGDYPGYRLSKSSLNALTIMFANEFMDEGIKVNAMCPGWVRTDMGGPNAPRDVSQGADTAVWLTTESESDRKILQGPERNQLVKLTNGMNIGLIFPNKDRRYKTVHLGLAYLASYAREHHDDLNFQVLDTRVATSKETKKFFDSSFDLIGITVFSPVFYEDIDIFHRIKKSDRNVPVCLGGPYVTTLKEEVFEKIPAEFAVYGEGEITFTELISHLKGKKNLKDIDGLMYRDQSGKIVVNPQRHHLKDLNQLPFPAYDIFPMERYPLHRMVTSRGCPYACSWCNSSSIWNHTYRSRNAENMISEIELLIENYGKKIFVFGDNSFNIDLKRVEEFCDKLISKNIKILWSISLRADNMTQETAFKMKEAGCYNVAIGIESASNEILMHINKSTTIEKITEGIKMMKKAGIEVLSQFVIGSPYETLETVKQSIEYARNSGCDYTNFYTVLPFKGTPQWDYVLNHGVFYTKEIHDFHTINPRIVFETPEFPYKDRLEAIRLVKKNGFYSNKDKKSWWFDMAKETSRKIQRMLPESAGERIYMLLKSIYRLKIVKKNNV